MPDIDFLPETVETVRGFVKVNEHHHTTDPKIFAIGDVVRPGLLTDAIGAGRKAAKAIMDIFRSGRPTDRPRETIDRERVSLAYFDPRITEFQNMGQCASQCSSCGTCRDCGVCVAICPQAAITRQAKGEGDYEYVVEGDRCIGCGFCAQACPCGVWNLVENELMN